MHDERNHDVSELNSQKDKNENFTDAKHHHKLSEEELNKLRNATLEEIYETDENVNGGLKLFLSNNIVDCEKLFEEYMHSDPIYASGNACVVTIKALLSMNQSDTNVALKRINYAMSFAEEVEASKMGIVDKIGGKIAGIFKKDTKEWLPGVFRARVILAESLALRAFLLLQQSTVSSLMKGGMSVRRCYNLLHSMYDYIIEQKKLRGATSYESIGIDLNSVYGVFMALGCVHIVLSILPPHAIRVLNFLGFTHDRELGVQLLNKSIKSNTLYSPIAGLFALVFNVFLAGFNKLLASTSTHVARSIFEQSSSSQRFDKSLIHLWLKARLERLEMNTDLSISGLSECLRDAECSQITRAMPQLMDFARYDQAWNYCVAQKWPEAIKCFRWLEEKSPWSRIFYAYAQGCCYDMMVIHAADDAVELSQWKDEASCAYWRAAHLGKTLIGGRTISIEDFLCIRLEEIHHAAGIPYSNPGNKKTITPKTTNPSLRLENTVTLSVLELMMIFDQLHQVPPESLRVFVDSIDKALTLESVGESDPVNREILKLLGIPLNEVLNTGKTTKCHPSVRADSHKTYKVLILATLKVVVLSYLDEKSSRELIQTLHGFVSKQKVCKNSSAAWVFPMLYYYGAYLSAVDSDYKVTEKYLGKAEEVAHGPFTRIMDAKLHFIRYAIHLEKTHKKSDKQSDRQSGQQIPDRRLSHNSAKLLNVNSERSPDKKPSDLH